MRAMPNGVRSVIKRGVVAASFLMAVAGFALIGLNVYGVVSPAGLPDDVIVSKPPPGTAKEYREGPLERLDGESEQAYARRLVLSLHYRIARGWENEHSRPAMRENFYLWAKGQWGRNPTAVNTIEFAQHERAIRRGYGLCSQFALAVYDVLDDQGIESDVALLQGHVVATGKFESGREWILDGDYGVVIPHSLAELERHPEMVESYYLNGPEAPKATDPNGPRFRKNLRVMMRDIYKGPNPRYATAQGYIPSGGLVERDAYRMKWLIPLGLLGAAGFGLTLTLLGPRIWRARRRHARVAR